MAVKGLLARASLGLKQIQRDPWLFLGIGAILVLFIALNLLAGPARAVDPTADLMLQRKAPVPSSSTEKRSPFAATDKNSLEPHRERSVQGSSNK